MRFPSPIKVQVRSGWHFNLSTPWLHQGCDRPPQPRKHGPIAVLVFVVAVVAVAVVAVCSL